MHLFEFTGPEFEFRGEIRRETIAETLIKVYLHTSGHTYQVSEHDKRFRKTLTIDPGSAYGEWENLES